MIYFKSRSKAREFATLTKRSVLDNGSNVIKTKRWAVNVLGSV